jgi:hypothetical protein
MDPLLEVATDLGALLLPSKIEAIAGRIRRMSTPTWDLSLHQLVTTAPARAALDRLVASWDHSAVHGKVLAGILVGASYARQKIQQNKTV